MMSGTVRAIAMAAAMAVVFTTLTPSADASPDRPRRVEDKAGRDRWLFEQRALPGREIPYMSLKEAASREAACLTPEGAQVNWESLGPAPVKNATMVGTGYMTYSGRALAVALDPSSPGTILLGTAQGGIWRSTDDGDSWYSVADNMPSLAIKVIRFAPGNPSIVYAGSGEPHSKTSIYGMGVFKSIDGGRSWTALPEKGNGWDFRYVEISGLQVDPTDPSTLYVTTANVLPDRVDPFHPPPWAPETGIYKSTDGGVSWALNLRATDYRAYDYPAYDPYLASGTGFMDLELYRKNPSVIFASERSGGIYRSIDSGEHWEVVTPVKNPGGGAAQGATFPSPVTSWAYFDDTANAFKRYSVIPRDKTVPEFNRIEFAIAQDGPGMTSDWRSCVLYAGCGGLIQLDANGDGTFDPNNDITAPVSLLFKSSDGGQTWKWLGDWFSGLTPAYCDPVNGGYENALYDNMVEVNPLDPDDVVVGGNANYSTYWPDPIDNPVRMLAIPWRGMVYRSVDGGANWVDTTSACTNYEFDPTSPPIAGLPVYKCTSNPVSKAVHPDIHCCAYDWPNRKMYISTDGGVFICRLSGDGRDPLLDYDWEPRNEGLSTLQFFSFGSHPTDPNQILGGMQDNSNTYWNGSFWNAWDWNGSDGTIGCWDPREPRHVYLGWQYALARHDNGGGKSIDGWKTLFDGEVIQGEPLPFATIFAIDPVKTNIVYVGGTMGLYRSEDRGDHWERVNAEPTDGTVTAISVSPRNHNHVWLGTSTGRIYLANIKKGKFYDRTGFNLPNRYVSAIQASDLSDGKVYITFSGYDASSLDVAHGGNGNAGKVFKSPDLGKSWKDISGNIGIANQMDVPVSALALNPKNEKKIWIGTDTGVYGTEDGGKSWGSQRGGMPVVAVMKLEYNRRTGYLLAGTFGRGIWRTK